MLIGIESSAASVEHAGDTTYMRELLTALATLETPHQYRLYDIQTCPFYTHLPRSFVLRQLRQPHALLRYFTSLPLELRRRPVDILHVQYILPIASAIPSVVTIHDLHFEHYPHHYHLHSRWWMKLLIRDAAHRADRIITGSQFSKEDICARYGVKPEKIAVLPYGFGSRFRPNRDPRRAEQIRKKYGITTDAYLLFIGRFGDPRKNVNLLVEAYQSLGAEIARHCQLVIVGRPLGRQHQSLRAKAQALQVEGVRLTGFVSDDDLPALISDATALVYPSLFEGFGLPVLEAMACGTPVVASRAAAIQEVAGEAALLIDVHNNNELAAALRRLLSDPELRRHLSELGLKRSALFSWRRNAQETLAIYNEAYQVFHATSPRS